jgi:hypothetical protein
MTRTDVSYDGPFEVLITEDCRDEGEYDPAGCLSEKPGICLGKYDPETNRPDKDGYPLIVAESGDEIWGYNCWWTRDTDVPIEELREALELHKADLRERLGIDVDTVWN